MGIGFLELVVIGIAALVLLGPQRLPEIMRHVAKFYVQIRRTSNDFKSAFDHVVHEAEKDLKKEEIFRLEQTIRQAQSSLKDPPAAATEVTPSTNIQTPSIESPGLRPEKPFEWSSDEGPKTTDPINKI
jgi:sec-independent protein translocase protein TatB